jgi:hypothetical protein
MSLPQWLGQGQPRDPEGLGRAVADIRQAPTDLVSSNLDCLDNLDKYKNNNLEAN